MTQRIIIFVLSVFLLTSCSAKNNNDDPKDSLASRFVAASAPPEQVEPSREAVFVYGGEKGYPKELVLRIGGDASLLPSGYLRLAGVVEGERPVALLEIGGRAQAVSVGEEFDNFWLESISENGVRLRKK